MGWKPQLLCDRETQEGILSPSLCIGDQPCAGQCYYIFLQELPPDLTSLNPFILGPPPRECWTVWTHVLCFVKCSYHNDCTQTFVRQRLALPHPLEQPDTGHYHESITLECHPSGKTPSRNIEAAPLEGSYANCYTTNTAASSEKVLSYCDKPKS